MLQVLEKASSERAAIDRLLADQSAVIRNAFNQFLSGIRSRSTLSRIASAIRKGDINEALDIVNGYVEKFANVLPHVFVAAATEEIAQLRRRPLPVGGIKFAFDAGNPDAAKAIANSKLRFIKDFGTTQRNITRKVLSEGLKAGDNPLTTARKFRDVIGLTENQAKAVANYQSMLERGSSEAFTRTLRDQRFDRTLASVIENDDVLEADQIERMVGRYTERMLAYRADTIARTETLRVVHEAKQTSWWQLLDSFGFDPDRVQRKWIATMDDATRDTHWAMHGQIVDGMDEPFLSPSGEELLYPGDEDAEPEEVINCFHPSTAIANFGFKKIISRKYVGKLLKIRFANGVVLSVTPNHPILTKRGWVCAGDLMEGDDAVNECFSNASSGVHPYVEHGDATASSLYNLAKFSGAKKWARLGVVNFHGEIPNHDIEIITPPRELLDAPYPSSRQGFKNLSLELSDIAKGRLLFYCMLEQKISRGSLFRSGVAHSLRDLVSFFFGHFLKSNLVAFTSTSFDEPEIRQAKLNCGSLDFKLSSYLNYGHSIFVKVLDWFKEMFPLLLPSIKNSVNPYYLALGFSPLCDSKIAQAGFNDAASSVEALSYSYDRKLFVKHGLNLREKGRALFRPVRVSAIDVEHYDGPVFNFETDSGLILANGIVTHNCRCTVTYLLRSTPAKGE